MPGRTRSRFPVTGEFHRADAEPVSAKGAGGGAGIIIGSPAARAWPAAALIAVSLASLLVVVPVLVAVVDADLVADGVRSGLGDPLGLAVIAAAMFGAFALRALAWIRLLGGVRLSQALAAVHVALGANHVLPFRLGEPLRIVSITRRTGASVGAATSTTLVVRSADVVSLVALGVLASPSVMVGQLGRWGLAVGGLVAAVGIVAARAVVVQSRGDQAVAPPDLLTLIQTSSAWLLEAVVVWQVASWFGFGLSPADAVLVLAVAVSAQLVAIVPAGVGTYEAAATVALVAVGVPAESAVALAIVLHGVKTAYSIAAGVVGVLVPAPGLFGRFRLPPGGPEPVGLDAAGSGPVMLFLPAHDEGPRIADVLARAPRTVRGREVLLVVVDDGSGDDTVDQAMTAGAHVIRHGTNLGLGAAVRTGLSHAVECGVSAVAFCDADGEYDPAELDQLVGPVLDGSAHYVVGSRFAGRIDHMLPHRRFGNRILTGLVRFVSRQSVTDGQSGYRALSVGAAERARIAHDYNYAQVLTLDLVGKGFGYHEVPITYAFRSSGQSFVRLGPYLRQVAPAVWRLVNANPTTTEEMPCTDIDVRPSPQPCS